MLLGVFLNEKDKKEERRQGEMIIVWQGSLIYNMLFNNSGRTNTWKSSIAGFFSNF